MVLAAACAEGLGSEEFVSMATQYASADAFLQSLQHSPVRIDQWQLEECARVARDMDVVLVAEGIPEAQRRRLFIRSGSGVEEVVAEGIARRGQDATIAVIPKGPYTLVGIQPRVPA